MSAARKLAVTCGKMQKSREARIASLPRLGWIQDGAYWLNPRSGRRYSAPDAVDLEDLRGTFARERMAIYNATRRPRIRPRGRPSKLELAA